jgi:hypothetical protein
MVFCGNFIFAMDEEKVEGVSKKLYEIGDIEERRL